MDQQDLRTLKILEEIEEDQSLSQRDIARKLNISLGLANSFIKRLAHKGYFKITNIPANRVKYILTPKGAAEKTKLTYEYIKYSFNFYQATRQRLKKLLNEMECQGLQFLVFYGAGELAEIAYLSLLETSLNLVAIADPLKAGENLLGNSIISPKDLSTLHFDRVLITELRSDTDNAHPLVLPGVDPERIVRLDD